MIDVIEAWLRLAATRLHEQAPALTALDQAIGDGDHGTNMDRGFSADRGAPSTADAPDGDDDAAGPRRDLRTAGRTLISTVGGAAGPLYGTAFMRAGGAVAAADDAGAVGRAASPALEAAIGGIGGARQEPPPARRRCSTRSSRPRPPAARRSPAGADTAGVAAADRRCSRGGRGRDDPDARDQGPRVVPRRAVASATRIPVRPRRHCCCAPSPTSPRAT